MAWSADRTEWQPPSLCSTGIEEALAAAAFAETFGGAAAAASFPAGGIGRF
jgi:hypothetical protein